MPDLIADGIDRHRLVTLAHEIEQIEQRNHEALQDVADDEYETMSAALGMAAQTLRDVAEAAIPCPECAGASPVPGVHWPVNMNGDETKPWVERCDSCEHYESDEAAAAALAKEIGGLIGYGHVFGGTRDSYPYVLAPTKETTDA